LGFVYTELIIADVKGILDFEEFIHVTTSSHVAFLVEVLLVPRAAVCTVAVMSYMADMSSDVM